MDRANHPEGTIQDIQHGWDVYGSDEQKVGNVSDVRDNYVVAHKGMFFPKDLYIPFAAIRRIEHDRVYLNIPKDEVDGQGWDMEPSGGMGTGMAGQTATGTGMDSDVAAAGPPPKPEAVGTPGLSGSIDEGGRQMRASDTAVDTGYTVPGRERDVAPAGGWGAQQTEREVTTTGTGWGNRADTSMQGGQGMAAGAAQDVGNAVGGAARRVEETVDRGRATNVGDQGETLHLHEEQLRVNKERVQAGEVELGKEIVEEQKTVNVPVTREEVFIERRPGDRQPDTHTIEQSENETVSVPVTEEKVNVEKVTVETGEVSVGTRQVQETQQFTDTVKREEARIQAPDDVRVAGDAGAVNDAGTTRRDVNRS